MFLQRRLDSAAADVLSPPYDQILDAIDDEEVALLVQIGDVAGAEPAVDDGLRRGLRPVPVTSDQRGAANVQLAALARGQLTALGVYHPQFQHGAAPARAFRAIQIFLARYDRADGVGLRHAPAGVRHGLGKGTSDPAHLLGRAGRSAAADPIQRAQIPVGACGELDEIPRHGRRGDE